jgi:hypothetical protein
MSRPLIVLVLWVIVSLPLKLQAQVAVYPDSPNLAPANVIGIGRVSGGIFGGVVSQRGSSGSRYYNVPLPAPLAGGPYSLPPAGVFSPFVYASMYNVQPLYTTQSDISVEQTRSRESTRTTERPNEIQMLTRKNQKNGERLRQPPDRQPEPPAQSAQSAGVSIVLVFRDGHQMEVQGYAIVGDILWFVTDQTSNKTSLSELDLDATKKLNAARGARFSISQKP